MAPRKPAGGSSVAAAAPASFTKLKSAEAMASSTASAWAPLFTALALAQWALLLYVPQAALRPHWPAILAFWGGERGANVYGNVAVTVLTLLGGNAFYYLLYRAQLPAIEAFRTNAKPWPWVERPAHFQVAVLKAAALTAFNVAIAVPIGALNYAGVVRLGYTGAAEAFPSAWTMAWQIAVFMLIEDTLFYWGHRTLHTRALYPWVHKLHHRFTLTVSISAVATHPLEYLFVNVVPAMAGPTLLGAHCVTIWAWLALRLTETVANHSGYGLPWSMFAVLPFQGSALDHDLHHSVNTGNFGSLFTFWDSAMGTAVHAPVSSAKRVD